MRFAFQALSVLVSSLTVLALIWFLAYRILTFLGKHDPGTIIARRRRSGECTNCGYDLTGNESGVCPECGEAI